MKKMTGLLMIFTTFFVVSCSGGSGGSDTATVDTDPAFTYIADSWVNTVYSTEMSDYWHEQGIAHSGTNY